ncbi:MAG: hypothetical protein Fues2KO_29120 [Fuerstiella sp.]
MSLNQRSPSEIFGCWIYQPRNKQDDFGLQPERHRRKRRDIGWLAKDPTIATMRVSELLCDR